MQHYKGILDPAEETKVIIGIPDGIQIRGLAEVFITLFAPHKKVLGFGLMAEHLSSKGKGLFSVLSSRERRGRGVQVSRCISWPICGQPTPIDKGIGRGEHVCRGRGDSNKASQATLRRWWLWIQHPQRPYSWLLEFLYLMTFTIESYLETKIFFKQKRKKFPIFLWIILSPKDHCSLWKMRESRGKRQHWEEKSFMSMVGKIF